MSQDSIEQRARYQPMDKSSPEFKAGALKYSLIVLILGLIGGSCLAYNITVAERHAQEAAVDEKSE